MRTAGTTDVVEYRRRLGVQRVAEGYSTQEVADFLGVDPSTVRRWLAADRHPEAGPGPGRPAKLTSTQEKIALRWLSEPPIEHGFLSDLWSAPRLAAVIERAFGVRFNPDYLGTWLRRRDYTPQKPRRVPRGRDDEAIAAWLARDWPRIKRKASRRGAGLFFLDESGLLMAPLLRRSWALRGHPPESEHKANHRQKVSVAAGLWLSPARVRLKLSYQTLVNGYFTNVEVAGFLGAVASSQGGPMVVTWDGGTMHEGEPIRTLLGRLRGRLDIEPLPAYAPMLNPVEFLWRWLKYGRLCNFAPRDASDLNEAIGRELDAVWDNQGLLASFFHQSDLPARALFS
ncbi:MAG: IS630 family transposase [Gemmataceae bacterium]